MSAPTCGGFVAFVVFAGATLPLRMLVVAIGVAVAIVAAALILRRLKPELLPRRPLPPPKVFAHALLRSSFALTTLGIPWLAATAAFTLKAALAWLPALALGGTSLIVTRRAMRGPAMTPA